MANLREKAHNYEPPTTLNIADLDKVSADLELQEKTGTKENGDTFTYNVIVVDDKEYRVPNIVLKQLKQQLEAKPDLEFFKVSKEGEGLKTTYTVVPL